MRRHWLLVSLAAVVLTLLMILSGCNTWNGAGKDVERTGEKMQGH